MERTGKVGMRECWARVGAGVSAVGEPTRVDDALTGPLGVILVVVIVLVVFVVAVTVEAPTWGGTE